MSACYLKFKVIFHKKYYAKYDGRIHGILQLTFWKYYINVENFRDFAAPPRPTLTSILSEKGLSGGLFVTAEVLFILRPFIYVLFIRKYGRRSWTPWIASLVVDLVGMGAIVHSTRSKQNSSKQIRLSVAEKDEVSITYSDHCLP